MGSFDRIKNKKTFKMLEFNQCQKFNKAPFRIYVDLECLIENIYGCKDNTENSYTRKVGEHISSSFSMPTILSFKNIENKHDVFRDNDCIKRLCESIGKHAVEITNIKKMNQLTNK